MRRALGLAAVLGLSALVGCAREDPFCVWNLPDGGCTYYQLFSCLSDACLGGGDERMTSDAGTCIRVQLYCQ